MISRLYQKWCGLTDNLAQRVPFHYGIILSMLALMLIVGIAIVSFWLSHHLLEQNKQFTQGSFDVAQNSDEMRMQFFQWQEHTATVGSQKTSPEQQLLTKTMAEALFISIGNELAWYADHPDEGADYTAQLQEIAALFSQLQQLQINMMARLPANRTHHTIAKMIEDKITTGTEMELLISGLQQQQLYSIQQSIEEVEKKQDLILWIGGGVVLLFSLLGTILLTLVHRATYLHIQSSLDVINTWAHGSFHTRVVSASLLAHAPPDHGGTLFASKYPFSALAHHINHLGDLVQVFLLETRSSLEAMAAGNTERRIQHEGFPWQLKKIAVDINANIDHVVDIYMKADADQANLDEFQRDLGIISQSLGAVADSMGMNGMELADASQLMETRVQTTEQEAGRVQQSMGQASQAVDAISESISEVAGQVREASAITSEAVEQAQETRAAIAQLEQASGNIGNMVDLITTIARQTQMLSMNATIEAARAGDAGRGFAVVASEVKALATQTSGAAQDISASIEEIQSTTHAAMQVIQTVAETIERIHAITKDIERNAEQQEHSAKGIASNVTQANRATTVMGENLTEVRTAADTTNSNVETMNTATEELRQSIDELDKIVTNYIGEAEPDDIELF